MMFEFRYASKDHDDGFNEARLISYDRMISLDLSNSSLGECIALIQGVSRLPEYLEQAVLLEAHGNMLGELRDKYGAQSMTDAFRLLKEKLVDTQTVQKWIESGATSGGLGGPFIVAIMRSYPEHEALLLDNY